MNNSEYIKNVKSYIASLNRDIKKSREEYKYRASLMLPIAKQWLDMLTTNKIEISEVENLAGRLFNIDKNEGLEISILFHKVSNWAEKNGLSTIKIKNWKKELDTNYLKFYIKYFKQYEKIVEEDLTENEQGKLGSVVARKWLKLINSSSVTQNDIDSIMNQILSLDEPPGSMWTSIGFGFQEWAEGNGFKVTSYNQLGEHFTSKFQELISAWEKKKGNHNLNLYRRD